MSKNLYSDLKSFWANVIKKDVFSSNTNVDSLVKIILLKFAENKRIYFSIFNFIDFKKEFSTPNTLEIFGVTEEAHREHGTELLFSLFDKEHANGIIKTNELIKTFLIDVKDEKDVLDFSFTYCGLKYHHSQKGVIKLLWKSKVIETSKIAKPIRNLSTFQDITSMMKGDFYWFRAIFISSKRSYYMTYRSDTQEISKKDILSIREKQILQCIVEGKETEEIAQALFISKTTINNHRQNMLNKLGARDTTSLIQLAKLTKLI